MTRKNFERINFEEAVILEFDYFSEPFNKVEFDILGSKIFNQKEGLIPRSLLRNKLFQDMEEEIY